MPMPTPALRVECPRCRRRVRPQRFTVYPVRHKDAPGGAWCDGVAPAAAAAAGDVS